MCTDLYYCDPEYVYEEQFNTVYYEDQVLLKHQIMESMGKLSLGFIGSVVLLQFGLFLHNVYKLLDFKKVFKRRYNEPHNKKVKIIRGVPGVGKRSYVYYLESDLNREFVICDVNDFFIKDGEFKFDGKNLAEAEADTMSCFLHALKNKDKRIYVIGTFEKTWMYKNYIELAKVNGYEVNVTELECKNIKELKHFNKRSVHDVPYSKSLKAFNTWENDTESYKRCPFLADNTILANERTPCLINDSDSEDNDVDVVNSQEFSEIPNIKKLEDCPLVREVKYVNEDSESIDSEKEFVEEIVNKTEPEIFNNSDSGENPLSSSSSSSDDSSDSEYESESDPNESTSEEFQQCDENVDNSNKDTEL
tara:strand:- start:671 stop:1759 length:1089 start_codon:yes stop_codon:yes gene_type:complete